MNPHLGLPVVVDLAADMSVKSMTLVKKVVLMQSGLENVAKAEKTTKPFELIGMFEEKVTLF